MVTYLKDVLINVIGSYTYNGSGIGDIDFEWIAAAAVFIICLWFTFSFIRTFLCGVMSRRW